LVRGLYTSASGAVAAEQNVDLIANNLANVSTGGFKRSLMQIASGPTMEVYRIQTDPGTTPGMATPGVSAQKHLGTLGLGSQVYDTPVNFDQGPMGQTGNQFDFGLQGSGFFTIQTPAGVRYTRNGEFTRNAQNLLVTQNGDLVLGRNGAITLPPNGQISVDKTGSMVVAGQGQPFDQLKLTRFASPTLLRPEGNNNFVDLGAGPTADTQTVVQQGSLEKSNANVVQMMVDLINSQRWFEANQKSIMTQDTANGLAIETVGKTQ
jgi:flagellar basal-body rod protein FlgG